LLKSGACKKAQTPFSLITYFFLEGLWLKVEPATVLLDLLVLPSLKTLEATEATLALVTLQGLLHLPIRYPFYQGESRLEDFHLPTSMLPISY